MVINPVELFDLHVYETSMLINFTKLSSNIKFPPGMHKLIRTNCSDTCASGLLCSLKLVVFTGCITCIQPVVCVWRKYGKVWLDKSQRNLRKKKMAVICEIFGNFFCMKSGITCMYMYYWIFKQCRIIFFYPFTQHHKIQFFNSK